MTLFDEMVAGSPKLNKPRRSLAEAEKLPRYCARCVGLSVVVLDGEPLCRVHADAWVRAEGRES